MPDTTIASFLVRFVQEEVTGATNSRCTWRGLVRHVQSEEQLNFNRIEDALAFMGQFVELAQVREANERRSE